MRFQEKPLLTLSALVKLLLLEFGISGRIVLLAVALQLHLPFLVLPMSQTRRQSIATRVTNRTIEFQCRNFHTWIFPFLTSLS